MASDVLISLPMVSADGERKAIDIWLPSSVTLVQAQGYLTAMAPLIDAINGAVLGQATVTLPLTMPSGLKSSAAAGSTVHRGGLFGFDNASPYKWSEFVPALTPTLFTGTLVNVGDTDVNAFLSAVEAGVDVSGTTIHQTNQYGDVLTTSVSAKESFRK